MRLDFFRDALPECRMIEDEDLRRLTLSAWDRACTIGGFDAESLRTLPAHLSMRECPITLFEHVRSVTRIAVSLAEQLQRDFTATSPLHLDYVLSGALLHDIGKIVMAGALSETRYAFAGHARAGAMIAEECGCPWQVAYIVANHSAVDGCSLVDMPELLVVRSADELCYRFQLFGYAAAEGNEAVARWQYKRWQ